MKRLIVAMALLMSVLVSSRPLPSPAEDRVQYPFGIQLPSSWQNQEERFRRLGEGQFEADVFGHNGGFSNLTIVPAGSLTVQVAPAATNQMGAVYQLGADDTNSFGGGPISSSSALSADPTQIVLQGLLSTATSAIGPLSVPSAPGQSVVDLIECQVVESDTNAQNATFVTPIGSKQLYSVNRDRVDAVSCQSKTGTAGASASVPTTDAGWVGVGYVTLPYGTTSVTSGMITMLSQIGVTSKPALLNCSSPADCTASLGQTFHLTGGLQVDSTSTFAASTTFNAGLSTTSISSTGTITAPTLTSTGVVNAASVSSTGTVTGGSFTTTGTATSGSVSTGSISAGSGTVAINSTYGGQVSVGTYGNDNSGVISWSNSTGSSGIQSNSGVTVNTIASTAFDLYRQYSGGSTALETMDTSGDLGLLGTMIPTRLKTAGTGAARYTNPIVGVINSTDTSPDVGCQSSEELDCHLLPQERIEVTSTGTGDPNAIYAFAHAQSTTVSAGTGLANVVGAALGAELLPNDVHNGVWGDNVLVALAQTPHCVRLSVTCHEAQMFGDEVDSLNRDFDPLLPMPQQHSPMWGIASLSEGDDPISAAFLNSFAEGTSVDQATVGDRPHIGLLNDDAIDYGVVDGDPTNTITNFGALQMKYGLRESERNQATSSQNYCSIPTTWFTNYWNGSAPSEYNWAAQACPASGTNPSTSWILSAGYNNPDTTGTTSAFARILSVDTTSTISANTFNSSGSNVAVVALNGNPLITSDGTNFVERPNSSSGVYAWQNYSAVTAMSLNPANGILTIDQPGTAYQVAFAADSHGYFDATEGLNITGGSLPVLSYLGNPLIMNDGSNTVFRPNTSTGIYTFQNYAGNLNLFQVNSNGAIAVNSSSGQTFAVDAAGDGTFSGVVAALTHNPCSAASGVPCEATVSCATSASTTCGTNPTVSVPSGAICSAAVNSGDNATGMEKLKLSLSGNTLTVSPSLTTSQSATLAANVVCL